MILRWKNLTRLEELSKEASYALRHAPWEYELEMDAEEAYMDGIKFYYGNEKVWLADQIPRKYIIEMS